MPDGLRRGRNPALKHKDEIINNSVNPNYLKPERLLSLQSQLNYFSQPNMLLPEIWAAWSQTLPLLKSYGGLRALALVLMFF